MTDENEVRAGLSWVEYDGLALKNIRRDWLALEVGLQASKWFDYRYLHPVQATIVYAEAFQTAYRNAFAETIDHAAAEHIRVVDPDNVFDMKTGGKLAGLWRGRQVADAIGMPYDVYLARAFHHTLRYWKRRHLPQATQVYKDWVVEKVIDDWAERQKAILVYSRLPIYRVQNYAGTKPQNDHHEWLFAQAAARDNPASTVARFLSEDLLPIGKVESRFEPEIVERILRYA